MTILNTLVINTKWQFHSCHFFLCIKENCCNRYAQIPITSPATQASAATPVFPDLSSRLSSTAASPRRPAPRFPPVSVPVSLPVKPFLSSVPRPLPFCRLPSSAVFLFPFVQALSRLPFPVSSVLSASFQHRLPLPLRSSLFPPYVFCLFPFFFQTSLSVTCLYTFHRRSLPGILVPSVTDIDSNRFRPAKSNRSRIDAAVERRRNRKETKRLGRTGKERE